MAIPASLIRSTITTKFLALWKERLRPTTFLATWFPDTTPTATRYVSIEVQRGKEKIAVDVLRNAEGNHNKFEKSTQKDYDPTYFDENFTVDSLRMYDRLIGSGTVDAGVVTAILNEGTEKMQLLADKIERRYELQRAQALQTGIVTATSTENIDFQRKASMILAYNAAHNFADNTVSISSFLGTWGSLMRSVGKVGTGTFDLLMGSSAYQAMIANTKFQAEADIRRIALTDIVSPVKNTEGADYMGMFSAGTCNYRIWVYDQYYEDASGVLQPYIDPKKIIILPPNPAFMMAYAGVPQLIDEDNPVVRTGKFIYYSYTDERRRSRVYGVQSAGLPILLEVDKLFTATVLA